MYEKNSSSDFSFFYSPLVQVDDILLKWPIIQYSNTEDNWNLYRLQKGGKVTIEDTDIFCLLLRRASCWVTTKYDFVYIDIVVIFPLVLILAFCFFLVLDQNVFSKTN